MRRSELYPRRAMYECHERCHRTRSSPQRQVSTQFCYQTTEVSTSSRHSGVFQC